MPVMQYGETTLPVLKIGGLGSGGVTRAVGMPGNDHSLLFQAVFDQPFIYTHRFGEVFCGTGRVA